MSSEFGGYVQGLTFGLAAGYDTENGITVSVFWGASAIVAVEAWTSVSYSYENGLQWEGFTTYAGYATPTGAPIGIVASVETNLNNGATFATVAFGVAGLGEAGVYAEGLVGDFLATFANAIISIGSYTYRSYDPIRDAVDELSEYHPSIPRSIVNELTHTHLDRLNNQGWTTAIMPEARIGDLLSASVGWVPTHHLP